MMRLRTMFMGSPDFAVPCLQALTETDDVLAVVSQPDQPAGRGLALRVPLVKQTAQALGLTVWQPTSVRSPEFLQAVRDLNPDLIVVVAYGKILPPALLEIPRFGCWNVHASLLPKYRGAAPIQWAVIRGEKETGVTLMRLDEGLDTGPMLLKHSIPIPQDITAGALRTELSVLGAGLLREGLVLHKQGLLPQTSQDNAQATMAPMLSKEIGEIDFAAGAEIVACLVRGCDPWPGTFTWLDGQPLKVFGCKVVSGSGTPGKVLGQDRDGLIVACGEGAGKQAVAFAELQLPGRKRLPARQFLAGKPIEVGSMLGQKK